MTGATDTHGFGQDRPRGLIVAAPSSGSGKTTLTLGILRALTRRGRALRSAKSGPDYIDTRFHAAATGRECVNLDAWAMTPGRLRALAAGSAAEVEGEGEGAGDAPAPLLLIEGAMGLFDGAPPRGRGATADLARLLGLPVVLVVDCARMGHSVAPLVAGFAAADTAVRIAGVICNQTGSPRHEAMLTDALTRIDMPVLGHVRRNQALSHPSRHLGLVQAGERPDLDAFLDRAAEIAAASIDLDRLTGLAAPLPDPPALPARLAPPGQRIAVARDQAFAFAYPHILADWRAAGAEILHFSPLADEAPPPADVIFLPGGYPELHAGRLSANNNFMQGLRNAAQNSVIYGECGGYMTLGQGLIDAEGHRHEMAGLLPLETSFAQRRLHLGYRIARALRGPLIGACQADLAAHEFHYASTLRANGEPLFQVVDATGAAMPDAGLTTGRVAGSFLHVIDRAPDAAPGAAPSGTEATAQELSVRTAHR